MDTATANDHCRELALKPGSLFEFTSQFVPGESMPSLLAVYALKSAICPIPHSAVDDSVKWEKLKWWGQELMAEPDGAARHPIILALVDSGARARLDDATLIRLVAASLEQVDAPPAGDEKALFERFSNFGLAESHVELALDDARLNTSGLRHCSAASTLYSVMAGFAPGQTVLADRLPLSMMAKHGLTNDMLDRSPYPDAVGHLVEDLARLGLAWFSEGRDKASTSGKAMQTGAAGQHLRLRWAVEERLLSSISKDAARFLQKGVHYGPRDAFFAWRFSRRMR